MHRGYIRLYRKGLEHPLFTKPLVWHFWNYCLLRANHKSVEVCFKNKPFMMKRGSFMMSLSNASDSTGLTIQNIRSSIKILENFKMIKKSTQEVTKQATIISVCNYETYQQKKNTSNTEANKDLTKSQHSANKDLTIDNNVNNFKNVKNDKKKNKSGYSDEFETWWPTYPKNRAGRKPKKQKAAKVFDKIALKYKDDLNKATKHYFTECNGLPLYAHRFLRNDFWKEFISEPEQSKKHAQVFDKADKYAGKTDQDWIDEGYVKNTGGGWSKYG